MKLKWILLLVIVLIAIPQISAVNSDDWSEVTVNKVTFKIPEKFANGTFNKDNTGYQHGDPFDFLIFSLIKYDNLKNMYGSSASSKSLIDIEETDISGHHAVVLYKYNSFYSHDYLDVFFATGKKIFRIQYNSDHVTDELKEIIKSTPKSKISEEKFLDKLDNAQRDYLDGVNQENLELDLEDYYREYNNNNRHESFYYWGSNGYGIGGSYRW